MLFFCEKITPRLQYIASFAGKLLSGQEFELTTDRERLIKSEAPKINYSEQRITNEEFWIRNAELLFENNIKEQPVDCFQESGYKAFFKTEGEFGFDIFAASFYLLSRYEEYLPYKKDSYGRFAHENSLAYRENFLQLPLVNTWFEDLKKRLQQKFPAAHFKQSVFQFIPTYDIDEAYSFLHKQWWRSLGGAAKSLIKGNFKQLGERLSVLNGKQRDPFDSYQWMDELHHEYNLKPYYFFLVAAKNGRFDKNILPSKTALKDLIKGIYYRYPTGVHPSWRSGDNNSLMKTEISQLASITGGLVKASRQHFIRLTLPVTYRNLVNAGIEFDFSMGYGSINGFRASVASPFYWYDLGNETPTNLLLYPFCFMEANSFFEQRYNPSRALEELLHYYKSVKSVNGMMITIWHNTFLGTDKLYGGWREMYTDFIKRIKD
jgi:hypothetical protein